MAGSKSPCRRNSALVAESDAHSAASSPGSSTLSAKYPAPPADHHSSPKRPSPPASRSKPPAPLQSPKHPDLAPVAGEKSRGKNPKTTGEWSAHRIAKMRFSNSFRKTFSPRMSRKPTPASLGKVDGVLRRTMRSNRPQIAKMNGRSARIVVMARRSAPSTHPVCLIFPASEARHTTHSFIEIV